MDWFLSTILNKLDAKGRVSVPAEFRKVLAGQGTEGLYCIKSISREKSLTGFGNTLLTDLSQQMKPANPLLDRNYAAQAHGMFGQIRHLAIDDEGRVRLPDDLIAHCGITERVAFVGLNAIFEIWNPETLEATTAARVAVVENIYNASGDAS